MAFLALLSLSCLLLPGILSVKIDTFYEFGELAGDNRLQLGSDDVKRVDLATPITFYDQRYSTVYISDNGYIAFEEPSTPDYRSEKFPLSFPTIGIFLGNSDTSWQGFVTYRENSSRPLVTRATKDVRDHFTSARDFTARSVLVVTWEYVGRFGDSRGEDANNYQLIVTSDGTTSYCAFFYLDDGIQWLRSQESDPYAEAGFDKGDDINYLTLPGSGQSETQASFVYGSNAGVRGMWLYQIGRVREPLQPDTSNEVLPDSGEGDGGVGGDLDTGLAITAPSTCASGTSGCHTNARCVDYDAGFCCQCTDPFYGNGKNCLEPGQPQRVNGKVSGTVNGVTFEDSDLHSYVVTAEGRAYTAVSRAPAELGPHLQLVYQTGGIISWLYGMTQQPATNGMTMTGGTFNRSLTLTFGDKVLRIDQNIPGPDQHGYLQMFIKLQGELPDVHDNARINVEDFNFIYTQPRPGVLKSEGRRQYSIDGETKEYSYEETVTYFHCKQRPRQAWETEDLRIDVARLFVVYDKNQKVVRYAMSAKVTPANAEDPCADSVGKCHSAAECVPVGDTYRCECRRGYAGSGLVCEDRDECADQVSNCNVNAQCYNTEGSFVCRCKTGYRGDGIRCEAEQSTCEDLTCDQNARCVFDPTRSQARCECNPGFRGNGQRCEREGERLCGENRCDSNARCVYDPDIQGPKCECNSGFTGDGVTCQEQVSLERLCTQIRCDANARCALNADQRSVRCVCKQGYTGDGTTCQEEVSLERLCTQIRCDANARCALNADQRSVRCVCTQGYTGDGVTCREEVSLERLCTQIRCDANARCALNADQRSVRCVCKQGYTGDGTTCQEEVSPEPHQLCRTIYCDSANSRCVLNADQISVRCVCNEGYSTAGDGSTRCRRDPTDRDRICAALRCDANAGCEYDERRNTAECVCTEGFVGDGNTCRPRTVGNQCDQLRCDVNARCIYDEVSDAARCLCNSGYSGDGRVCNFLTDEERVCQAQRCDTNARCIYEPITVTATCECNTGYRGDGRTCTSETAGERLCEGRRCHEFGECVTHEPTGRERCLCKTGYTGNGYTDCRREAVSRTCADVRCDVNARCTEDPTAGPSCRCNQGYTGDGFRCQRQAVSRTCADVRCDVNARCTEDPTAGPSCRCNRGYTGDGFRCQRQAVSRTCADVRCDVNARCTEDPTAGPSCRCNRGYTGDGYRCQRQAVSRTCADVRCDVNARCYTEDPTAGPSCRCNRGYTGDGYRCQRQAVSRTCADVRCDVNARCTEDPTAGPSCRCNQGYTGDGYRCQRQAVSRTCADVRCDVNGRCTEDPTIGPICRCIQGYTGDGYRCQRQVTCEEVDNCHPYASCVFSDRAREYGCVCREGYTGDGVEKCLRERVEPTPDFCDTCSEYANCVEVQRRKECQCLRGFSGDGKTCYPEGDCNVANNCDTNARCVLDVASSRSRCLCNDGFQGNGYKCKRPTCEVTQDCHEKAACLYDLPSREYGCKCNDGYEGDGKLCRELQCNEYSNCHRHAACVYNQRATQYECRCKDGYSGDGKTCQVSVIPCNQVNTCDPHADCLYEVSSASYGCQCRTGYRGNGFRCVSTADCRSDRSMCHGDASCIPSGDAYKCICKQGFRGDGKMCMAEDKMHDYLLFTQGMSIFQIPEVQKKNQRGNLTFMIPAQYVMSITGQTAVGIDFDCRNLYFYYTDVSGRTIGKARLDGTDSQNILQGLGSPEGIAVDWLAGNVFWTDSALDRIEVSKTDGTNRKTIVDMDLVNPRGIAVDPSEGRIYWSDWNRAGPRIESSNMDGSDRRVIVDEDLGLPNGLVYDYQNRKLCWGDAGKRRIECSNNDGTARRTVYGLASYPFDLAILGQKIYWTDWEQRRIQNIDIDGGLPNQPLELPVGGNGKLYGITAVVRRCPRAQNACALGNGGCRFLCLPMPNGGRTCACPDDISEQRCNEINLLV